MAYGQIDTVLHIQAIEINAAPSALTSDKVLDSVTYPIYFSEQIGPLIIENSNIFIKSYGSGSLATLSLRGGNANQALVKWNDIPIANPMLGLSDLSLLPLVLFENAEVSPGGYSVLEGNGAMTGLIRLSNNISTENKSGALNVSVGSFGKQFYAAQLNLGSSKLKSQSKIFYNSANNDFNYSINSTLPERKQTNANFESRGLMQNLSFDISQKSRVNLDIWLQKTFREIPPTTTQNVSEAEQDDILNRYVLSYTYFADKFYIKSKLAYLDEENNYRDAQILIDTENQFKRWFHQSRFHFNTKKALDFSLFYEYSNTTANTEFYADAQKLDQIALGFSARKEWSNLSVLGALRKEWNQNTNAPLSPLLTIHYQLDDKSTFELKVSKEFRFPTLNELFWIPGGNADLLPEQGWNQELTYTFNHTFKNRFSITLYHRLIDDWILWGLLEGSPIYSVTNLAQVRSYGGEIKSEQRFNLGPFNSNLKIGYAYTISENQKTISNPTIERGDQIFYTPVHRMFFNWNVDLNCLNFRFNSNYTSSTVGINNNLEGYLLSNIFLSKKLAIGKQNLDLGLRFNNIFNTQYRVIERRPMPGRNFTLNLNFNF